LKEIQQPPKEKDITKYNIIEGEDKNTKSKGPLDDWRI